VVAVLAAVVTLAGLVVVVVRPEATLVAAVGTVATDVTGVVAPAAAVDSAVVAPTAAGVVPVAVELEPVPAVRQLLLEPARMVTGALAARVPVESLQRRVI